MLTNPSAELSPISRTSDILPLRMFGKYIVPFCRLVYLVSDFRQPQCRCQGRGECIYADIPCQGADHSVHVSKRGRNHRGCQRFVEWTIKCLWIDVIRRRPFLIPASHQHARFTCPVSRCGRDRHLVIISSRTQLASKLLRLAANLPPDTRLSHALGTAQPIYHCRHKLMIRPMLPFYCVSRYSSSSGTSPGLAITPNACSVHYRNGFKKSRSSCQALMPILKLYSTMRLIPSSLLPRHRQTSGMTMMLATAGSLIDQAPVVVIRSPGHAAIPIVISKRQIARMRMDRSARSQSSLAIRPSHHNNRLVSSLHRLNGRRQWQRKSPLIRPIDGDRIHLLGRQVFQVQNPEKIRQSCKDYTVPPPQEHRRALELGLEGGTLPRLAGCWS